MYRIKELSNGYMLQRRIFFVWFNTYASYSSVRDGLEAIKRLRNEVDVIDYHYLD